MSTLHPFAIHRRQQGISLIELMIALTLSSLLMLGVMRMFMDNSRSNTTDSALAQVQDSARVAMEMIKRDVRMAGFKGQCVSADAKATVHSLVNFNTQAVIGIEGNNTTSDTLAILRAETLVRPDDITKPADGSSPVRVMSFNANSLKLDRAISVNPGDVFMVSDCRQYAVFRANINAQSNKSTLSLIGDNNATISLKDYVLNNNCSNSTKENCPILYRLGSTQGLVYDIRNTGRVGSDGQPIQALFRDGLEMVEGIENFQVIYGVRAGDRSRQATGCSPAEFANGRCNPGDSHYVQISLVIASSNNTVTENNRQSHAIANLQNNQTLVTNDRRLRRVFNTTVQLRNQG